MVDPHSSNDTWIDRALDRLRVQRLHPIVEIASAWFVATVCLLYYGYSYVVSLSSRTELQGRVPLTTFVRRPFVDENDIATETQRLYRLIVNTFAEGDQSKPSPNESLLAILDDKAQMIALIRNNLELRRNVSKFVLQSQMAPFAIPDVASCSEDEENMRKLYYALDSIWLDLLRLPSVAEQSGSPGLWSDQFDVSLILPAYREDGASVARTVRYALRHCAHPRTVQVIVVNAGLCTNLEAHLEEFHRSDDATNGSSASASQHEWGDFQCVAYTGNGGRGPCQNFGAERATGRLFTFLHSDTQLPWHWDVKVQCALRPSTDPNGKATIHHACSFSIGHNVSREGLNGHPYPWGIRSILFLGNVRAYLFRLPYGDHILAFPALYFRYIGGFPDQPIMEDYDIMDLLRRRAMLLRGEETLCLIAPPTSLCSVRRWQALGVTYVTLTNAILVHRYAHQGWTAAQVYDYYYRRPSFDKKED
jgi:hypothetical protein